LYETYREKIKKCDDEIEVVLKQFEIKNEVSVEEIERPIKKKKKTAKNARNFDLNAYLIGMTGVDLTQIPNREASTALREISVIGLDMERWKSDKHFASWLGLCPGNKVSGGKRLGGKTKRTANAAAAALRLIAQTLYNSPTAIGSYYRRMRTCLGAPKAITATAHKLARIIYNMLKHKKEYTEIGQDYYEHRYRERIIGNLKKKHSNLGSN